MDSLLNIDKDIKRNCFSLEGNRTISGRLHKFRRVSKKISFVVLRKGIYTLQCVLLRNLVGDENAASQVGMFTLVSRQNRALLMTENRMSMPTIMKLSKQEQGLNDTIECVGECLNTIYNSKAFDTMTISPPIPLIQPYFSCAQKELYAIKSEIGNAYGAMGLFVNSALLAFIIVVLNLDKNGKYFDFEENTRRKPQKKKFRGMRRVRWI